MRILLSSILGRGRVILPTTDGRDRRHYSALTLIQDFASRARKRAREGGTERGQRTWGDAGCALTFSSSFARRAVTTNYSSRDILQSRVSGRVDS